MRNILICSMCLLVACERTSISPVEIKIDNDIGGFATGNNAINNTYTVVADETLFDVANKFNIDPMNLAKTNGINAPYNIHKGQVLKLPIEGESVSVEQNGLYAPVNMNKISDKESKELNDQFANMMKVNSSGQTAKSISNQNTKKEIASSKQAESLSSPKVVATANGNKINTEVQSSVKKTSSGKMIRPVNGTVISKFGEDLDGIPNDGINIKASAGTAVKSVSDGEIIYAGNNLDESFGNVVVVQHQGGLVSSYAHLKKIGVKKGSKVKAGQIIGSVGKTGDVSEPQLHFEIMKNDKPENPEKFLEKI